MPSQAEYAAQAHHDATVAARLAMDAALQEIERLKAEAFEAGEHDREIMNGLSAEIGRLRAIMSKHYPTIAGRVIQLQQAHEDRAAAEWQAVADDFREVLRDA